jgi:hypothetical protein
MGKRKTAAKTGDKKLYSQRNTDFDSNRESTRQISSDDFHQERDESFMALESKEKMEEPTDDAFETKQHILDLGVDGDSSGDEDEDSDDEQEGESSEMEDDTKNSSRNQVIPEDSESSDGDSSEGEGDLEEVDPRNWGRRKSAYYSADTGDLEIGQDEDVGLLCVKLQRFAAFRFLTP